MNRVGLLEILLCLSALFKMLFRQASSRLMVEFFPGLPVMGNLQNPNLDQKGHHFIVRLGDNLTVETATWQRLLEKIPLAPGQVRDLGWVKLRQDGCVTVRLVGIWAKGQREPWWLATNLTVRLSRIASLYDRRMGIEEQIRDTKGCRFGIKLFWTQFQNPDHLARLTLILAFALLIFTALGRAILRVIPSADLPHPTKGARLSLISLAFNYGLRPIGETVLNIRWLRKNLPPPKLRKFDWIEDEKESKKRDIRSVAKGLDNSALVLIG